MQFQMLYTTEKGKYERQVNKDTDRSGRFEGTSPTFHRVITGNKQIQIPTAINAVQI
jgi:hypothetical protein